MTTPPTPPQPGQPQPGQPQPGQQPGFEQVLVPPVSQQPTGYPPAPSQAPYAPPYGQPGYPPPAKSSNTALKIILIVVAVIVLFGVLVASVIGYGAYKLSKAVHNASTEGVSFSTPSGTTTIGGGSNISSGDLGLPEYPGAKRGRGGMKMKTSEGSIVSAIYTTPDAASKVVEFYKAKLGEDASLMESGENTVLTSGQETGNKIVVTITPEGGDTKIMVMHATSK